jgi:hypothetical protein
MYLIPISLVLLFKKIDWGNICCFSWFLGNTNGNLIFSYGLDLAGMGTLPRFFRRREYKFVFLALRICSPVQGKHLPNVLMGQPAMAMEYSLP